MAALLIILLFGLVVTAFVFAMSLSREKGALSERIRKLEEQAEVSRKQAEIMAQARSDDETIARLDRGDF